MQQLLRLADEEGVSVSYKDLSYAPRPLYGLYFAKRENAFIVLHKSLLHNLPLHRSVFAEELGHHFTVPLTNVIVPYTSYSLKLALSRDEERALRWACDFLMPDDKFVDAFKRGIRDPYELAEYFVVTPWLVRRKQNFFNLKYPNCLSSHGVMS